MGASNVGPVAIVTGGAAGIGRAAAGELARRGAAVVVADRDEREGERAAAGAGGPRATARSSSPRTCPGRPTSRRWWPPR